MSPPTFSATLLKTWFVKPGFEIWENQVFWTLKKPGFLTSPHENLKFFISNNLKLMTDTNADGIYVSSYNHNLNFNRLKKTKYEIIGSAHNFNEIRIKELQKCSKIFLSPIFKSKKNQKFLSTLRFNFMTMSKNTVSRVKDISTHLCRFKVTPHCVG